MRRHVVESEFTVRVTHAPYVTDDGESDGNLRDRIAETHEHIRGRLTDAMERQPGVTGTTIRATDAVIREEDS